jgi:hypothetical protein
MDFTVSNPITPITMALKPKITGKTIQWVNDTSLGQLSMTILCQLKEMSLNTIPTYEAPLITMAHNESDL